VNLHELYRGGSGGGGRALAGRARAGQHQMIGLHPKAVLPRHLIDDRLKHGRVDLPFTAALPAHQMMMRLCRAAQASDTQEAKSIRASTPAFTLPASASGAFWMTGIPAGALTWRWTIARLLHLNRLLQRPEPVLN
jgi:hypothetical protein